MCSSFFFSSRRRHTRWPRDWSSDVCSSDLVVNKVDAADEETLLRLKRLWPDAVFASARTGVGLAEVRAAVEAQLPWPAVELRARVPYERGDLVARAHARGEILHSEHTAEGTVLHVRVDEALAAELAPYVMR